MVPPKRGVTSLVSDEPVGRYPTVFTTPEAKPITPKEGVTDETPTVKPAPQKGGKGVMVRMELH